MLQIYLKLINRNFYKFTTVSDFKYFEFILKFNG